jgi:hypothetical protein
VGAHAPQPRWYRGTSVLEQSLKGVFVVGALL